MCVEKESLLLSYIDALNTLLGHLRLQADAIGSGDPDYSRYDSVIEAAERHRKQAASAYSAHAAHHGCGFPLHLAVDSVSGRLNRQHDSNEEVWMPSVDIAVFHECTAIAAGGIL